MKRLVVSLALTLALAGGATTYALTRPDPQPVQHETVQPLVETIIEAPVPEPVVETPAPKSEPVIEPVPEPVQERHPNLVTQAAFWGITYEDVECLHRTFVFRHYYMRTSVLKQHIVASVEQYGSVCAAKEAGYLDQGHAF